MWWRSKKPEPRALAPEEAVAQLLLEIARADLHCGEAELAVIRAHLAQAFELNPARLNELMPRAGVQVEQAVSLHDSVQLLNRALLPRQKVTLVRSLWQVAYADGRLDPYEEALLRRLADLLHIPHGILIREKHGAGAEKLS